MNEQMSKSPKRPRDTNKFAKFIVDIGTGKTETLPIKLEYCQIKYSVLLIAAFALIEPASSQAGEDIKVFGANFPHRNYAFVPAGTSLACTAINNGRCYDGKVWHNLFPLGPRKYAVPTASEVECVVIANGDCWTGKDWYRLPRGRIFGRTMATRGWSFFTSPLRP